MNENFKIIVLVSVLMVALAGCHLPPNHGPKPHRLASTTPVVHSELP